jgi:oligosaccharide repeat unit polymerase
VPAALATIIVSIALLGLANSAPDPLELNASQLVLAATFIVTMVALILTSLSIRMQVCFQILYIYLCIYLILPGFNHVSLNDYPFYRMAYRDDVQLESSLIVAVFCAVFVLIQCYFLIFPKPQLNERNTEYQLQSRGWFVFLYWVLTCAAAGLFLVVVGPNYAFGARLNNVLELDAASATMITVLPRAIGSVGLGLAFAHARMRGSRVGIVTVLAFLLPTAVLLFPPAIARGTLFGTILLCCFATIDFSKISNRLNLTLLFLFGAVVAMPVTDMLTRGGRNLSDLQSSEVMNRYFKSGDFDGLQSINNAVLLVESSGLQGGKQLLSSILFFLPRTAWPTKAEPTGIVAARAAGYKFLNISQPIPGEFFVDFGLTGMALCAAILAFLMLRLDRWIDKTWNSVPASRLIAGAFVAYSLMIFRGSLGAVIGPVLLAGALCLLIKFFGYRREISRENDHEVVPNDAASR